MKSPVAVMAIVALAAVVPAACSGGKSSSSSTTTTTTTTTNSSPAASPAAASPGAASTMSSGAMTAAAGGGASSGGAKIFATNCSSCHQANGKGQPGVFPPLAGNAVVTGTPTTVIHIVKDGLSGKIQVAGSTYNGQMAPWKGTLSDSDIASVVTYIRSSWGNHASAVTASQVTATK